MSNEKCCSKCLENKHLSEFNRDKRRPAGVTGVCKHCRSARNRLWYSSHGGREKRLNYRRPDPEKERERCALYRDLNREALNEKERIRAKKRDPKKRAEYDRIWARKNAAAHPERILHNNLRSRIARKIGIPTKEMPNSFIKAKGAQILLKRKIKELSK